MARKKDKKQKEPGRIRQVWQVFQMTRKYDRRASLYLALAFFLPLLGGVGLAFLLANPSDGIVAFILYIIMGLFAGILAFIIVLGRRAEKAAYSQIEGQPGAVGAVLKTSLRRSWLGSEMPVAVSPRSQDAVYRAIGRGGIVLIGEGPRSRTQRMLEEQRRAVVRVVPNVPVNFLYVGPDPDSTPLYKIPGKLRGLKSTLRKAEVLAVSNRLKALEKNKNLVAIPKGMDPLKARASRAG
jgi:Domain of unknown function (DUF4191)